MRNSMLLATLFLLTMLGVARAEAPPEAKPIEPIEPIEAAETQGEPDAPPSLADFAFLVGHWRGEALGGIAEEVWLEPAGGAMMGTFRLAKDGEVSFYEIFTIGEPDLTLRLKHFHADLTGWEERDEIVTFPFVSVGDGEAVFEGLTFRLLPDDRLRAAVEARRPDGTTGELVFLYERVR